MTVATPIEVRQVAFAKEVVRGTVPAAPTSFISCTKDSEIAYVTKLLEDPALRGYNARYPSFPGQTQGSGPLKTPLRAQNHGEFFHMLYGPAASSTEQASFTVVSTVNDRIDFNIGAGQLTASLAAGTYVAGQTQADSGTLCKLVYDAIVAAEAVGVYTVSFNRTTGLFTITRSGGTFQLIFLSGTNNARSADTLLGYAHVDRTGALTYTGVTVINPPFKHTFTQGQVTQLPSYAFYIHRGMSVKQYALGQTAKLKLMGTNDGPVELEASVMAQQEAAYGGSWSPTYSESPVLLFSDSTVKFAGSAPTVPNVKSWSLELDPGVVPYDPLSQSRYPQDFLAKGPFLASGDMVVYFHDEVERAKFLAVTQTSLEFLMAGSVISAGYGNTVKFTVDQLFPSVEYEAFPFGDEDGFLGAKVKWRARYSTASAFAAQAYVINQKVSY